MRTNQLPYFLTMVLLSFSTLLHLTLATNVPPSSAYFKISNTLSTYCYLLDSKNFTGLSAVFTSDVVANFPEPLGLMNGVGALATGLNRSLFGLESQHLLGSISIEVDEGGERAESRS